MSGSRLRARAALHRKNIWYLAPTALNGVVSIASVPLLIYFVGSVEWARIALGQSVGLVGSVVVGLGWPVVGPTIIGRASVRERYRQLVLSLWARLAIATAVLPLILALLAWVFPGDSILLWITLASTLLGCSSSWYFLGTDDPQALFWREAVVRSAGAALGLAGVALTGAGEWFAVGLVAGLAVSIVLTIRSAKNGVDRPYRPKVLEVLISIRSQANGLSTNALFVGLASVALPLVAVIGGPLFVVYAVVDKVQKQLTTLALPLAQLITGKMAGDLRQGAEPCVTAEKMLKSIVVSGALLAVVMIPLGPLAVSVMSVGVIHLSTPEGLVLAAVVGLAFVAQCIPTAVLAPIDKLGYSLVGMSLAMAGGIPAIILAQDYGLVALLIILCVMFAVPIVFGLVGLRAAQRNRADRTRTHR